MTIKDSNSENLGNIVKQVGEHTKKITSQIEKTQEDLANTQTTGEAGLETVGTVKVIMNGRYEAIRVSIDPKLYETPEVLCTLVAAAFNHAVQKVQKISQKMIMNLAGSMQFPAQLQNILKNNEEK